MKGVRARLQVFVHDRPLQVLTLAAVVAATAAAAAPTRTGELTRPVRAELATVIERAVAALPAPEPEVLVWEGADVDGDGAADFANPTGGEQREHDAYGSGAFGASRDGGVRRHEGVDFVAEAGQTVVAPISGYVTKIGYAYGGASDLRFVEISNPALRYQARTFYIRPGVKVGEAVHVGDAIGKAHSLQGKYPNGMTDHVHLEVIDRRGVRIDAHDVLTAQYVPASRVG